MKGGARKIEDARIINDRCRKKYSESFIYPEMIVPGYNFSSSLYRFDITGKNRNGRYCREMSDWSICIEHFL